ncbi:MAG TPA: protein kinase, partial [Tepidisphaeraceae bacterium]|nr:protein kinase [Tepidisphaeraceae bacterium]
MPSEPGARPIVKAIAEKVGLQDVGVQTVSVDKPAPAVPAVDQSHHHKHMTGRLGGYEIIEFLGRGTMGSVYLARQLCLGRMVALKTLHKTMAADPQLLLRFMREAYAAAQLQHPNIVQIYDLGTDRGVHFFSMEYVAGKSLMELLRERGRLAPGRAVAYVLQAARGLKFAHNYGLIHRDVKPDNLLLGQDGIVKIADLGLVRQVASRRGDATGTAHPNGNPHATQPYHTMGTPTYMAPEQARDSASADGRADIYSLGCTLYTLLAGRPPFQEKTVHAMLEAHATQQAMPPDLFVPGVSANLSAIVMRMMARNPKDRFQKMSEVIAALEAYLELEPTGSNRPAVQEMDSIADAARNFNASPWLKIRQALIGAFFLLCVVGAVAAFVFPESPVHKGISLAAVLGVTLVTSAAYLIIRGAAYGRPMFLRLRQMALPNGCIDLLGFKFIVPVAMVLLILYALNLMWAAAGLILASVLLAAAVHALVDRRAEAAQSAARNQAEKIIQNLRERGVDENIIHHLVLSQAGSRWRGIFESLFGQETTAMAVMASGDAGGMTQEKWIDRLVEKANTSLQRRWESQKRQLLAAMEARWRMASGISLSEARSEAIDATEEFLEGADIVRKMAHEAVAAATAAALKKDGSPSPVADARVIPRDWANRPADLLIEFSAGESAG